MLTRMTRRTPMTQLCILRGTAILLVMSVSFMHSFMELAKSDFEAPGELLSMPRKLLHLQSNTTVDVYPQNSIALDPYDMVPMHVRKSWGDKCRGRCEGVHCAASRDGKVFHKALTEVLAEWVRITSEELHPFTSVLNFGSLIASRFRNGTQSQWDQDLDASIWAHDTGRLDKFAARYNRHQTKFYLAVNPYWRIRNTMTGDPPGPRRGMYESAMGMSFQTPNARLYHTEVVAHIDMFPMYVANQTAEGGADMAVSCSEIEIDTERKHLNVPQDWIFPLQPCYLNGVKTTCPARGGELLGLIYGGNKDNPPRDPDHALDLQTGCWENSPVVCGAHEAKTCGDCPQGNGEPWCHGDCIWCNQECVSKNDYEDNCAFIPYIE